MTRDTWKLVGERMRELDLVRLDELAAALADPDGAFADLPEPVRTAALDELETAFCDPAGVLTAAATAPPPLRQLRQGQAFGDYAAKVRAGANGTDVEPALTELRAKVEAFAGLTAVDWALPPAPISDGEPGAAIAAVQDGYRVDTVQDWDAQADPEPDPLIGYRDYLRNLWVDGDDEYDTILANRFHQDFHTSSLERRPLNEILIPVLRRALVAPTGAGHGLGLDPATVPERPSGQPARTYLDTLVTLSGISATELGLRYRIDLTRPDTALSTEVEVNIATIRGFFADDFQSVDPHSIIHKDLQGKAPFYLQFDEWRRQFGPFFPENHYQVASCVPIGAGADPERAERLRQFPPSTGLAAPLRESWLRFIELRSAQWVFQEGLKAFGRLEYGLARNRFAEVQGMIYRFRPSDTTAQAKLTERQQAVVGNWRELAPAAGRPGGAGGADPPDGALCDSQHARGHRPGHGRLQRSHPAVRQDHRVPGGHGRDRRPRRLRRPARPHGTHLQLAQAVPTRGALPVPERRPAVLGRHPTADTTIFTAAAHPSGRSEVRPAPAGERDAGVGRRALPDR